MEINGSNNLAFAKAKLITINLVENQVFEINGLIMLINR